MQVTFSERHGFVKRKALQVDSMDEELKTSLWICLERLFDGFSIEARDYGSARAKYREFLEFIWTEFFKKPKNQLVQLNYYHIVHSAMRSIYDQYSWDMVYSLIEFIAKLLSATKPRNVSDEFKENCNYVLERESSGWRFVNDEITPLTTSYEVQAVEEAFEGVGEETAGHLSAMLRGISQKGEKNYRTAATEAILALEAFGREVANEKSKILSDIIRDKKLPLDEILQQSLSKLYAYANAKGIRHAQMKGQEVDFEIAKFMILQCTSYINLMKANKETIS